ncbi:MAG: hypothetical protein KF905_02535 [Flavobacteriales bacterium]|nr:hypothetical protein [Flavobacteriales bacterium]
MPIYLYRAEDRSPIPGLDVETWDLASQVFQLEQWLKANSSSLTNGPYVADIGFMVREDASGGGAVITLDMMKQLLEAGVELHLSEYIASKE